MDFYVTLPSKGSDLVSEYGKLNNTKSDFETELKIPLELEHKKYEVGLTEFSFRRSWLANMGNFRMFDYISNKDLFHNDIEILDGQPSMHAIHIINLHMNSFTVTSSDSNVKNSDLSHTRIKKISIFFNKFGKVEIRLPYGIGLEIRGYFASLLRTTNQIGADGKILLIAGSQNMSEFKSHDHLLIIGDGKNSTQFDITSSTINYIQEIYIYTDIINEVHVGNKMLKLLRVVSVPSKYDENISVIFNVPHYLSLDSSLIEIIRMFICDSSGNKIRFLDNHSQVLYKLHFKLK